MSREATRVDIDSGTGERCQLDAWVFKQAETRTCRAPLMGGKIGGFAGAAVTLARATSAR
jgi:hypothetical protein